MTESESEALVRKGFQEYLSSHGYGFQHAIIAKALEMTRYRSPWFSPIPEFPVQVQNDNTRIDIVFQHSRAPWFLVCECKRANPSIANWCFIGSSSYEHYEASRNYVLERIQFQDAASTSTVFSFGKVKPTCFNAGEVRTNAKGDAHGSGRGVIEEAATQVLRSVNGLIEYLKSNEHARHDLEQVVLVPVVFTTASLYVSDTDLASADLQTGAIDLSASFHKVPWLIYQYPQSQRLRHSLDAVATLPKEENALIDAYFFEFQRSIAVVSAEAVGGFLQWDNWQWVR